LDEGYNFFYQLLQIKDNFTTSTMVKYLSHFYPYLSELLLRYLPSNSLIVTLIYGIVISRDTDNVTCHTQGFDTWHFFIFYFQKIKKK